MQIIKYKLKSNQVKYIKIKFEFKIFSRKAE